MLIEDLIRLGRPLIDGDMTPDEVLRLITDVADDRVKNFYRNVFVVVLPADGGEPVALVRQQFGDEVRRDKKDDFDVAEDKALGVPITLPTGGNPLNPQGRYGLPVYPLYDPHVQAFRKSAEGVAEFLEGRLERTENFALDVVARQKVALAIHQRVTATALDPKKNLGILVLACCKGDEFFQFGPPGQRGQIGDAGGRAIVPNYRRILDAIWEAKVAEGRSAGVRSGPCSIDNTGDESGSAYCKAWPWAFPTWTCPLPDGGDEAKLVEGIALSPASYRALTLGACVFNKLTRPLHREILREVFSPSDSGPGRDQAQRRNLSDLPTIVGSAFLLPVQDRTLDDGDHRFEFVRGIRKMLAADPADATQADRFLTGVVGFDVFLPDDLPGIDDYRLSLVYFSGDYTRGDVKLRAVIHDVVPSKLSLLRTIAQEEAPASMTLLRQLLPYMSEKQQGYYAARYDSVPWLLARAYGGAYLWSQLEALLHGQALAPDRVTTNLARRLESLVPTWPKSGFAITEEASFYLNVLRVLDRANREVAGRPEEYPMPLRHWKEMLAAVDDGPVEELLADEPTAAELGFASGVIVKRFSRRYYVSMKRTKLDADFLRDRVLTFGSALRWEAVQHKALKFINELPNNQLKKQIKFSRDLAERAAAVSDAVRRRSGAIERDKDEFLTAFWCGYALQGYDRPPKTKTKTTTPQKSE